MPPFVEKSRFSKGKEPLEMQHIFANSDSVCSSLYFFYITHYIRLHLLLWSVSQDIFYGMDVSRTGSLSLNELRNALKIAGNFIKRVINVTTTLIT